MEDVLINLFWTEKTNIRDITKLSSSYHLQPPIKNILDCEHCKYCKYEKFWITQVNFSYPIEIRTTKLSKLLKLRTTKPTKPYNLTVHWHWHCCVETLLQRSSSSLMDFGRRPNCISAQFNISFVVGLKIGKKKGVKK